MWARNVAFPAAPEEYVEAAVDRLMTSIDPYVGKTTIIRSQFNAINGVRMIYFETEQERKYYEDAYSRYLEAIDKLEASDTRNSKFMMLVEWLKFRQAAEFCRCNFLAREMYHDVQEGYAAMAAMCFKASMAKVVSILHSTYKVPRSQIGMIWGGSQAFAGTAERFSTEDIQRVLLAAMAGDEVPAVTLRKIKQQLIFDSEGLGDLPPELNLGPQNPAKRQLEIDRLQRGEALFGLYSFKAGGVGLSLHHCDDMTKEKVRRKRGSNYAYLEDIPNIPTRPRKCHATPTFSAVELVQGLGRCPRLTSLSDTIQTMYFYRGTIEEKVAAAVSQKLKCLKKVIRGRESWEDIISGRNKAYEAAPPPPDVERINGNDMIDLDDGGGEDEDENND